MKKGKKKVVIISPEPEELGLHSKNKRKAVGDRNASARQESTSMDYEMGDDTGRNLASLPASSSGINLDVYMKLSEDEDADRKSALSGINLDILNANMKLCLMDESRLIKEGGDNDAAWRIIVPSVLIEITEQLGGTQLKDKFIPTMSKADARGIIATFTEQEFQEWKTAIKIGFETENWASLIEHSKLMRQPKLDIAPGVPIQYQEAVLKAWGSNYRGNAHTVLLKAIDEIQQLPPQNNYAKLIPIAQSSGTGKSKTVDMVARERILFPLCLREEIGQDYFAYPPADRQVRNYFTSAPSTANESECKRYISSFLSSLFIQAQSIWLGRKIEKVQYANLAKTVHECFSDPDWRNEFYNGVVARAKADQGKEVWKSFKNLQSFLKNRCLDWPPSAQCPLLLSIDEVHILYTHRPQDTNNYTLYSRMKSIFHEGVSHAFVVISLSTASHISSLAPSKEIAPSLREKSDDRILPTPFTELPFDAHIIAQPLVANRATLASVGSLRFAAKFGRPLFFASYLSRKNLQETKNLTEGIMSTVREKLSGRTWPPKAQAVLDASSIAILSARLHLQLSPTSVHAKRYEEEGVRNHLRMLYSVREDRETIVTGSSSEPLVAEASAQIMHHVLDNKEPYMNLWDLLCKYVDHGLASQGAVGELIGRALSISAMDHAIRGLSNTCELPYQTPVTVADYYKALLTDEAWEALRKSVPANRANLSGSSAIKTFEAAFANAYFHFSHYGKANDASPMKDTCAWAYWLRGVAIVCQDNQELTDRMMPIYFSGLGNVSPKTISVNLEQDKTGLSVNPCNVAIQSAESLSIFSPGNRLPYISVVHCYASTDDLGIKVTKALTKDLRNSGEDSTQAPRYQIDFCGLNAYRNFTGSLRSTIPAMIDHSKNSVFLNHSREYGVDALRQMLPVFTKDPASTKWFGRCN